MIVCNTIMAKIIYYILQSILFTRVIHRPIIFTWLVIDKDFLMKNRKRNTSVTFHVKKKRYSATYSNGI